MFDIRVSKLSNTLFNVEVLGNTKTVHSVHLSDDYYNELTNREILKEDLIKKSFEFLLKKESNENILREFNLIDINKYFSDFEEKIK